MVETKVASRQSIAGDCCDQSNPCFKLINETEIIIPENYQHHRRLSTLNPNDFHYFNNNLIDENFKNASTVLQAGKKYKIKIFQVLECSNSETCIEFLEQQGMFVNANGLSLVYQFNKELFAVREWMVSLDKEEALYKDKEGRYRIPEIYLRANGRYSFGLKIYEHKYFPGTQLICFSAL